MEAPTTGEAGAALIGAKVGEYRVVEQLGSGGMATVYGAIHPFIDKRAAVKVMSAALSLDANAVARFVQEARAVNRIKHPNIVDVFSFGRLPDGRSYYLMEWLDGVSLLERLRLCPLGVDEAVAIADQVADALEAAHEAGVIHRDLKPANVLLVPARGGGGEQAKLLDFGVAKLTDVAPERGWTREGCVVGTPDYISPEQARGHDVDGRTDLYALGVMLYEMVTGELPFDADNPVDVMRLHLTQPAPRARDRRPQLPGALDRLIARLLEKRADRRPSIAEVRATLASVRAELRAPRPRRRAGPRWALAAALLAAMVSAGWWASGAGGPRLRSAGSGRPGDGWARTAPNGDSTRFTPAASAAAGSRDSRRAHHPSHRARRADPDYLLDPFARRR